MGWLATSEVVISETPTKLQIAIASPRRWWAPTLGTLFFVFVVASYQKSALQDLGSWRYVLVSVIAIAALSNLLDWLWTTFGRMVITVEGEKLTIDRGMLGLHRVDDYVARKVWDIRYHEIPWILSPHITDVRFTYGDKLRTIKFAMGIRKEEAERIRDAMHERIPQKASYIFRDVPW